MKVVLNRCHGGASLSNLAAEALGLEPDAVGYMIGPHVYIPDEWTRTQQDFVEVVERLGEAASGPLAQLEVAEIPEGVHYLITEYDGYEGVNYSLTPIMGEGGDSICDCCAQPWTIDSAT